MYIFYALYVAQFQTTVTPPSPGIDEVHMRNSSSNPNLIQYAHEHNARPHSMPEHVIMSTPHEQHIKEIKLREEFCTKAERGQATLIPTLQWSTGNHMLYSFMWMIWYGLLLHCSSQEPKVSTTHDIHREREVKVCPGDGQWSKPPL